MKLHLKAALAAMLCTTMLAAAPLRADNEPAKAATKDTAAMAATAAKAPKSIDDANAWVVVGDVKGFIQKVGEVIGKVRPGTDTSQATTFLGVMLGNPTIGDLPAGSGVAMLILPNGDNIAFAELPEPKAEANAKPAGFALPSTRAEGLTIFGKTQASADAGKALAADVKAKLLGGKRTSSLHVTVPFGRILKEHDKDIRDGIADYIENVMKIQEAGRKMGQPPSVTTATARMLEGEFRVFHKLVSRIKTVEFDLDLTPDGIRTEALFIPEKPVAPKAAPGGQPTVSDAIKLISGQGAMRMAMEFNPEAITTFMEGDLMAVLTEMGLTKDDLGTALKWMKDWNACFGGAAAFDMFTPGSKAFGGQMIVRLRNPETALKMLESMPEMFKASGLTKLYEDMGAPVTIEFKKNAREIKGIPVHELRFNVQAGNVPNQLAASMKMWASGVYQIAAVDNWLLYLVGEGSMEEFIDAVKAKSNPGTAPLAAEKIFGAGGYFYTDYNIGAAMKMMQPALPDDPANAAAKAALQAMSDAMASAPPLLAAAFNDGGRHKVDVIVPLGFLEAVAAGAMKAAAAGNAKMDKAPATTSSATREKSPADQCAENLSKIDGAKEQWALDTSQKFGAEAKWDSLIGDDKYLKRMPVCPDGGVYTIGKVGEPPTCSIGKEKGHALKK
ncbi:MAG: hypothetical protein K1X53_10590 [Candidatus Sumerlaeaceae bacterium]|nr:hypothetical protein [Candidatus Sumerlaeaceae bacterium]